MGSPTDEELVEGKQPTFACIHDSLEHIFHSADTDKEAEENYMSGYKLHVLIFSLGLAVLVWQSWSSSLSYGT